MTLVAAWLHCGIPTLIGDLLITSENSGRATDIGVATREDASSLVPIREGVRIEGTIQKVYCLSDNLALGWTGSAMGAEIIVHELRNAFGGRQVDWAEFRTVLGGYQMTGPFHCVLIGWLIDGNVAQCFRWDSAEASKLELVADAVEGSGRDAFMKTVNDGRYIAADGDPIGSAVAQAAYYFGTEVLLGENLIDRFGGGMQLICYEHGAFRVVDKIVYVFVTIQEKEDGMQVFLHDRILRTEYRDNLVVITRSATAPDSFRIVDIITAIDAPRPLPMTSESFALADYNYFCMSFSIFRLRGDSALMALVEGPANKRNCIRVTEVLDPVTGQAARRINYDDAIWHQVREVMKSPTL